jgi:S-adenosylmethionine synthetase
LAYAIGVPEPVAIYVNTLGTGRVDEDKLATTLREMVRLTPRGIREHLDLLRPIYARTSAYGHFGRTPTEDGGFSWERTDLADELARTFGVTRAAE